MVLDQLKMRSDDSPFNEDHVMFLLNNFRSVILKQRYENLRKDAHISNFQTICVPLAPDKGCNPSWVQKSLKTLPSMVNLNGSEHIHIHPPKDFTRNVLFTIVNNSRFKVCGNGKWQSNFIYATIGFDQHLYLKSQAPELKYLEMLEIDGLFDDPTAAYLQSCEATGVTDCNIKDQPYPLEMALIPLMIQMTAQSLAGSLYNPIDDVNNASDDISNIGSMQAAAAAQRYTPQKAQQAQQQQVSQPVPSAGTARSTGYEG